MNRSKWKGPYINITSNLKNVDRLPMLPRNYEITSNIVGHSYNVHTGKKNIKITITDDMVGHKAGEFSSTREVFSFKKKKKKNK